MLTSLLLSALLTLLSITGARAATSDQPLTVFASVLPIQTFVERVGGERVDARVMVLPGQSPHTYDPTPAQVAALAKTDLYVRVGVPFEEAWMPRIRSASPDMAILDLRDGLPMRKIEAHDHEEQADEPHNAHETEHAHDMDAEAYAHPDSMDPHIWTSPPLVRRMVGAIRDRLSALDPSGADIYAANQAAFDAELAALDADLKAILEDLDQRRFLVYHPAWGYFADTYGLEQIPIEREGKSPGPRRLDALIRQARERDTQMIFVQPQFDRRAAQQVARAIGGRVETADPLAADYAENLRRFARLIVGANARADESERVKP